jgi:putative transcriptional regulator
MRPNLDPYFNKRPESLAGHFLIADIDLKDVNFYRSVVLITDHNAEGAFGLIVNRDTDSCVGDVIPDWKDTGLAGQPLYIGGPVGREFLFVLHGGMDDIEIKGRSPKTAVEGVVFEPLTELLAEYLKNRYLKRPLEGTSNARFFAGYSGWGPLQLEREVELGSWFLEKASSSLVFSAAPATTWEKALSVKGPLYEIMAKTGYRPSMN